MGKRRRDKEEPVISKEDELQIKAFLNLGLKESVIRFALKQFGPSIYETAVDLVKEHGETLFCTEAGHEILVQLANKVLKGAVK